MMQNHLSSRHNVGIYNDYGVHYSWILLILFIIQNRVTLTGPYISKKRHLHYKTQISYVVSYGGLYEDTRNGHKKIRYFLGGNYNNKQKKTCSFNKNLVFYMLLYVACFIFILLYVCCLNILTLLTI